MMKTTPTMSFAPATKVRAMRLGPMPPERPRTIPMPKKSTAIWSMYHCHRSTPTTRSTMEARKSASVPTCRGCHPTEPSPATST
jgi:hypothetical protein